MSSVSKRKKDGTRTKIKSMGDHNEFLQRITKTLYYGQLPTLPCLSLPVTEISCDLWSEAQRGRSLRRLHADAAADIARSACVSPCALVLAILYLERLHACNPHYLAEANPKDLFLVTLLVSNKFLQDDGEDDEVICSEWAASGGIDLNQLKKLEIEFLNAIDWNIFVSEKSFETGLSRLERQVAMKQAQTRGFFTYSDLTASCDDAVAGAVLRSLSRACAAALLAHLAACAALLASALLVTIACVAPAPAHSPAHSPAVHSAPLTFLNDTNVDIVIDLLADEAVASERLKCCTRWSHFLERSEMKYERSEAPIDDKRKPQPWWGGSAVLNWLYRSSLINPTQWWLERVTEYVDLVRTGLASSEAPRCNEGSGGPGPGDRCVRQWFNLSKLSVLVATVSDR